LTEFNKDENQKMARAQLLEY